MPSRRVKRPAKCDVAHVHAALDTPHAAGGAAHRSRQPDRRRARELGTVRVRTISTTPIKGFGLAHPSAVELDAQGARGDRDLLVVDDADCLLSITRTGAFAGLTAIYAEGRASLSIQSDGKTLVADTLRIGTPTIVRCWGGRRVAGHVVLGPFAEALTQRAERAVRLVRCDAPGAGSDIRPVTLLGSASVDELARRTGHQVDPRRFRMLFELETTEPHVEDRWTGCRLQGEEVAINVLGPVPRCAAITRDPDSGDRDDPLVKAIRAYRGMVPTELGPGVPFGVYAEVERGGWMRTGETVTVVAGATDT